MALVVHRGPHDVADPGRGREREEEEPGLGIGNGGRPHRRVEDPREGGGGEGEDRGGEDRAPGDRPPEPRWPRRREQAAREEARVRLRLLRGFRRHRTHRPLTASTIAWSRAWSCSITVPVTTMSAPGAGICGAGSGGRIP